MSCEICGRSTCTRSFHSLEAQREFDDIAEKVKDRMKYILLRKINKLVFIRTEKEEIYVKLDDVEQIIDNYN